MIKDFAIATALASLGAIPLYLIIQQRNAHRVAMAQLEKQYSGEYYQYSAHFVRQRPQCLLHAYRNIRCGDECPVLVMEALVKFIDSAQATIDMCMYHFTLVEVYDAIVRCTKRNVQVRCIADRVMCDLNRSKYKCLKDIGIVIKVPRKQTPLMHHKFIMLDALLPGRQKVLNGSLNLTISGLVRNDENIVITNNAETCRRFHEEFEELWSSPTFAEISQHELT